MAVLLYLGIVLAIAGAGYGAVIVLGRSEPLNVEDRFQ